MTLYKIKSPFPDETLNRYRIARDEGLTVVVEEVGVCKNMSIRPTYRFMKDALEPVKGDHTMPKSLNGDLQFDVSGIRADPKELLLKDVKKNECENDGELQYTIEVRDNSYFYVNKADRNQDYNKMTVLIRKHKRKFKE